MSVKSKATGAAVLAVAPEAELAEGAAATAGKTAGTKAAGSAAGAKAAGKGRATAARSSSNSATAASKPPATASPAAGGSTPPEALTDMRGAPGWYQRAAGADPVALGNTGGGFLLGVALWAVGLAYLRGGSTGVRQLLAAKFLNRPAGASAAYTRPADLPPNTAPYQPIPRPGVAVPR